MHPEIHDLRVRRLRIGPAVIAATVAAIIFTSGLAQALPVTLSPPYATTTPVTATPTTFGVGSGFLTWPNAPAASPSTGAASSSVWARANVPAGGHYQSVGTQAGLNIAYTCTKQCNGATHITFKWTVAWNFSYDLTCTGNANVRLEIIGQVSGGVVPLTTTTLIVFNTGAVTPPASNAAGVGPSVYTVGVTLPTGSVLVSGTTYNFETWLDESVDAHGVGGAGLADASVYVNVGGGTLNSVTLS